MNEAIMVETDGRDKIIVTLKGQAYKLHIKKALACEALTPLAPKITNIALGDVFMQVHGTAKDPAQPVMVTGSFPVEFPGRPLRRTVRLVNETGFEPYSDVPDMTRLEAIDWLNTRDMVLVGNVRREMEKLLSDVCNAYRKKEGK